MTNALGIIIPVYANLSLTQDCVESVLAHLRPQEKLLVIDDASPEPALRAYCQSLREHPAVTVIAHADNRGFVQSVNEGFVHFSDRDIVILNSDTRVAHGWLDKLHTTAYAADDIATVTPLSNNAEIASYPIFCQSNKLPLGTTLEQLNQAAEQANSGAFVDAPTGVGFCMYIKRACLDQIGGFNAEVFGKGYGEENDFCLRASARGWRHVIAVDTFVYHQGGASFGAEKAAAIDKAGKLIADLYPHYHAMIHDYIQRDPLRSYRQAMDRVLQEKTLANMTLDNTDELQTALATLAKSNKAKTLFITHQWGGGVEQHIQDLLDLLGKDLDILVLRGAGQGGVEIDLPAESGRQKFQVGGFTAEQLPLWIASFQTLGLGRVHIHHVQGWPAELVDFILALNVPVDITAHDYYPVSPYYHKLTSGPRQDDPSWPEDDAGWQAHMQNLIERTERIIAPSQALATALAADLPQEKILTQAHPERLQRHRHLRKVSLIGALSPEKGQAVAESVATLAATQNPALTFSLLGYPSSPISAPIAISGSYDGEQLPRLLAAEKPDCIWFPAQVPETYNYALSHAMTLGVPIVATNTGSFPERLQDYPQAHLLSPDASDEQWLSALTEAVAEDGADYIIETVKDSRDQYRSFYLDAAWIDATAGENHQAISSWGEALLVFPESANTSLKNLYDFAVYCRHQGKMDEVRQRLSVLGDEETDVVGAAEADKRHRDYLSVREDLDTARERLQRCQFELQDTQEEVAEQAGQIHQYEGDLQTYKTNLQTAKDNIATLQEQARSAQAYINHLQELEQFYQQRIERYANSYSWRITRPLRITARLIKSAPTIARQLGRHLFSLRSYRKLAWFIVRGHFRLLAQRTMEKFRALASPTESDTAPAIKPLPAVQQDNEPPMTALEFPQFDAPQMSILIPVYGQERTTWQCLKSILENPPACAYEVIVSDDCSPASTEQVLNMVSGVRFVRQPQNLGFLRNVNTGSEQARGELLIILNNDTLITAGALDALAAPLQADKKVGLVGAKLINADGSLQEAGGIIWRDGSGWNWGRNQNPNDPAFNYYREVDYCSGAALALHTALFRSLGGFDDHYQPAYYEDTDLAFKVREQGLKVVYQPKAVIYHLEGISHGTDENQGVKAYQTINAEKFRQRWQTVLAQHQDNGIEPLQALRRYHAGTILIVEACMITPDQDSGSIRLFNLMQLLRDEGYHVIFVPENMEYREKPVKAMQALGIEVLYGEWAKSVKHVLRRYGSQLDAVFLTRHYVAVNAVDWARQYAPQATLIFDTVDLHFVREQREAEVSGNSLLLAEAARTRKQELDLIRRCDITLVVSQYEQDLLAELMPEARVEIISNIHSHTPKRPGYTEREGIIFVGGFRHTPNIDAIQWYVKSVVPLLRDKLPDVETSVIGSHMPGSVRQLATEGVNMLGFVEDIDPLLQRARVSIAPLRYGAGVKGKVNEAMNYGIPVVATECAVEGMHLSFGEDVLVADSAEDFADAIVRVYHDENLWNQLSTAGIKNIEQHFSPASALPAVKRILHRASAS